MTSSHQCFKPIPDLIGELNRNLKGWANYFSIAYPTGAYWQIDWYVRGRLIQHDAASQTAQPAAFSTASWGVSCIRTSRSLG